MGRYLTDLDLSVLEAMLDAASPMPAYALSRTVHASPHAAAAAIERLTAAGCRFDHHPQHGSRLLETSLGCWSDFLECRRRRRFGRRTLVYRRTASTQEVARQLIAGAAESGDFDGYLVAADHQTAGRGRLGRTWRSRPGDQLLVTAIIADRPHPTDRLMLTAAVAVSRCVESFTGRPVELRWPNDVYVDRAKLAGMLVETLGGAALVGIGLNVRGSPPHAVAGYPTTHLRRRLEHVDRLAALDRLAEALTETMNWPDDRLADHWRRRAGLLQQRVTVDVDGRQLTGRVIDIDPKDGLVFEVERGPIVTLPAASTSIRPVARIP